MQVKTSNCISVIICCFNSVARLPSTLRHLALQQVVPGLDWEVIVVDNNSADATAQVAADTWTASGAPAPLVVIKEPNPGLSNARRAGINQAQYGYLLFCDDDNWLAPSYLACGLALMQSNAAIGVLGGLNVAVSDGPLPAWFSQFESAYACGPQAVTDGPVADERLYINGAGMIVRREVLDKMERIGFKSQLTDRKGADLSSGGDSELCAMAAILGYRLWYDSSLLLQHYLESRRLNWSYLIRMMREHAKSDYKLLFYRKIYKNEVLPTSWTRHLLVRGRTIINRELVTNLAINFGGVDNRVGDKQAVARVWEFERLKAHLEIRNSYVEFIIFLRGLITALTGNKLDVESN